MKLSQITNFILLTISFTISSINFIHYQHNYVGGWIAIVFAVISGVATIAGLHQNNYLNYKKMKRFSIFTVCIGSCLFFSLGVCHYVIYEPDKIYSIFECIAAIILILISICGGWLIADTIVKD